ncbi:MAG: adenosine kinase [Mariprofundaceae bacterium]
MNYDVYGVGNAIMDLQFKVDDAFLKSIHVDKGVMTLVDESRQQQVLDALASSTVSNCSGGSACNTVVGVAGFGGTAAYACKVGSDQFGDSYVDEMRKLGIAIDVPVANGVTGSCVVLISPDAQRTMLTHLGVSAELSDHDIDADAIAKATYVYIEGYLFTGKSTRAAALKAIDIAKQHDVKVALTVSDPFLIDLCHQEFIDLIEGPVDLLFCNLEEARALTGLDHAIACAKELHRHCNNVCLTMGSEGSIMMHEDEVIAIKGVAVDAMDTTGAGDMYAAGVLYGITNELSWYQAGQLGSHAASRVVSQLGARMQTPFSTKEIEAIIN